MNDTNQAPSSGAQAINLLESLGLWAYVAIGALLAGGILLLSISFFQKDPATRDGYGKLGNLLLFSGLMSVFSIRFLDYVSSPAPSDPDSPAAKRVKTELIGCTTAITILLGMAFIVIQRYTSANTDGRVLGILAMWGGACMLMGVLSGFLFGIPKELETSQLEQIADWITKIIVGVGLTQLSKIPHKLRVWAEIISSQAGTGTAAAPSTSFIIALILYFITVGFLAGYLLTTLFLGGSKTVETPKVQQTVAPGAIGLLVENQAHSPESGPQITPPMT